MRKNISSDACFPLHTLYARGGNKKLSKNFFTLPGIRACMYVGCNSGPPPKKAFFSSPSRHRLRRFSYLSLIFSHNRYSNELPPPAFGKNEEFSKKNPSLRLMQWMENEKNIFSFFLLLLRRHFPPFFLKIRGSRYMPKWVSASCLFLLQEKERD